MPRKPSGKPKRNIWTDPSPYGTYTGPRGTPESWRRAFRDAATPRGAAELVQDDDPWAILGLKRGVSYKEAKSRYRKLVRENHPDHGGNTEVCSRIIAAWTIIEGDLKEDKR